MKTIAYKLVSSHNFLLSNTKRQLVCLRLIRWHTVVVLQRSET